MLVLSGAVWWRRDQPLTLKAVVPSPDIAARLVGSWQLDDSPSHVMIVRSGGELTTISGYEQWSGTWGYRNNLQDEIDCNQYLGRAPSDPEEYLWLEKTGDPASTFCASVSMSDDNHLDLVGRSVAGHSNFTRISDVAHPVADTLIPPKNGVFFHAQNLSTIKGDPPVAGEKWVSVDFDQNEIRWQKRGYPTEIPDTAGIQTKKLGADDMAFVRLLAEEIIKEDDDRKRLVEVGKKPEPSPAWSHYNLDGQVNLGGQSIRVENAASWEWSLTDSYLSFKLFSQGEKANGLVYKSQIPNPRTGEQVGLPRQGAEMYSGGVISYASHFVWNLEKQELGVRKGTKAGETISLETKTISLSNEQQQNLIFLIDDILNNAGKSFSRFSPYDAPEIPPADFDVTLTIVTQNNARTIDSFGPPVDEARVLFDYFWLIDSGTLS